MAELRAYNPTFRERSTQYVANLLRDKFGMDNYRSYDLARDIFGDESSPTMLGSMGIADFTPAGAIFGGQEGARMYQRSDDLVGKGLGAGIVGLSALEGLGPLGLAVKAGKKVLPKADVPDNPDLQRRAVVKGLAALPVATTAVAKGIAEVPMGAASKVAKAVPNITGSNILDKIPFVRDKLSKVYDNSFITPETSPDGSPVINYLTGQPFPRRTLDSIDAEEKLTQNYIFLSNLEDAIRRRAPKLEQVDTTIPKYLRSAKYDGRDLDLDTKLSSLPTSGKTPETHTAFKYDYDKAGKFGETNIPDDMNRSDHMELLEELIADSFIQANPDMTVREALEMVHKEGTDTFRKLIDETPDDSFTVSNPNWNPGDDSIPMDLTGKEAKEAARKRLDENPDTPVAELWYDALLQGEYSDISTIDVYEGAFTNADNMMKALKSAR